MKLKLRCIPLPHLRVLASNWGIPVKGSGTEIIEKICERDLDEGVIDHFIKQKYAEKIQKRRTIILDEDLKEELRKVKTFSWGIVQGQLDQKIQAEYVRKIVRYEDLLDNVKAKLHHDVTNYVICTWFNHWTTILIEEHISMHPKVVPSIKSIKGVDIFFGGQPFDLKVTYLPRGYDLSDAVKNPSSLAVWMYENQGAQRFGADNRLFVILLNKKDPEKSWELKRDFAFVFQKIDNFFNAETVSEKDTIVFTFGKKTYTAITKLLLITK